MPSYRDTIVLMLDVVLNGIEKALMYGTVAILFQAGVIAWTLRDHFSVK